MGTVTHTIGHFLFWRGSLGVAESYPFAYAVWLRFAVLGSFLYKDVSPAHARASFRVMVHCDEQE